MVEEDLANVFGRGLIVPAFEDKFKKQILKDVSIVPLYSGSDIQLQPGPGLTVARALKMENRRYLSTAIQLSMLDWSHRRTDFATALVDCMIKRTEMNLPDATPDVSYDAIVGTLECCSSQAPFPWDQYYREIEYRIRGVLGCLDKSQTTHLFSLAPHLLLGAMDYLYIVQRLPQHRKVMVRTNQGVATLILWAHYLLGLTVLLKPDGALDIVFGKERSPEVIIIWYQDRDSRASEREFDLSIDLLDQDLEVVLKTSSNDVPGMSISRTEHHSLAGYGSEYLRRFLNTTISTPDNSPLYSTLINIVLAFSLWYSRRLLPLLTVAPAPEPRAEYQLERWRVVRAAEMIFQGFEILETQIDGYTTKMDSGKFQIHDLPWVRKHLENEQLEDHGIAWKAQESQLSDVVKYLVSLVLAFAHVVEVSECAELPLEFTNPGPHLKLFYVSTLDGGPVHIGEGIIFQTLGTLLTGRIESTEYLVLVSDFGWSVYFDCIGDDDPANIRPELVHIKKGVPTSVRTKEKKNQIRSMTFSAYAGVGEINVIDEGENFIPRCLSRVTRRVEYYSAKRNGFVHYVRLELSRDESHSLFISREAYVGYRSLNKGLWVLHRTKPCQHKSEADGAVAPLGPDMATIIGRRIGTARTPHRVLIHLVKGDPRARMLAALDANSALPWQTMLRTPDCCVDCALKAVSVFGREMGCHPLISNSPTRVHYHHI